MEKLPPAYDPGLYDLLHCGNEGDVAFYLQGCQGAGPVLELGCGSGRLTAALAQAGLEVWAMDAQAGMIEALKQRVDALPDEVAVRIHPLFADMADFSLPERFARIIIPYNGLYCLLDDARLAACLGLVCEHLQPGGKLMVDAYVTFATDPDFDPDEDEDDDDAWLTVVQKDGADIEVIERCVWKPDVQFVEAVYTYRVPGADGLVHEHTCRIPQRYLSADQLRSAIEQAGFVKQDWFGDFAGTPFDDQCQTMIVIADKAAT